MSGLRILPVNFFDEAVNLTATSSAGASLAITNLQSDVRGDLWRSTSLAPQTITGDFGGNVKQVSAWGLWPGDSSSLIGAQIRVRLWSDVAKTTLVYDSGTLDFFTFTGAVYGTFLWGIQSWGADNADRTARLAPKVKFFTAVAASAFEITITNAGAVDTNHLEARRFGLWDYVEAPYNALLGLAPQWVSMSSSERTPGGSVRRNHRQSHRAMRFETVFASEADRSVWSDLQYVCDLSEIVISLFPGNASEKLERDHTVLGSLEVLNPFIWENVDFHRLQLAIKES